MQGRAVALFESVYATRQAASGSAALPHSRLRRSGSCRSRFAGRACLRQDGRRSAARVSHAVAHLHAPGLLGRSGDDQRERVADFERRCEGGGRAGELRDFHSLNYLSYNYLQLGRYKDAKKAVDLFAAQYAAITEPQDGARLARPAGAPRARPDDLRPARSRALRLLRHARPLHRRIGIVERRAAACRSSRRRAISW